MLKAIRSSLGGGKNGSSSPNRNSQSSDNLGKMPWRRDVDGKVEKDDDALLLRLRGEAKAVMEEEPIMCLLFSRVGLVEFDASSTDTNDSPIKDMLSSVGVSKTSPATSFDEVVARSVCHLLSSQTGGGTKTSGNSYQENSASSCPAEFLLRCVSDAFASPALEMGRTMSESVREDALAIVRRDPACRTLLEAVLFMKGFAALVVHRAARRHWSPSPDPGGEDGEEKERPVSGMGKRFVALLFQSMCSAAFAVDIHPAATIGAGVMLDHATGIVIGETAHVGDNCTILHGVTLGGTGKDAGDRHPKIGSDVLIGAGTKILGNIHVGDRAKIGAGSVVLRPIPSGATAVGSPARIIGITPKVERPGSSLDMTMMKVEPLSTGGESVGGQTTSTSSSSEPPSDSTNGNATDVATNEGTTAQKVAREEKVGIEVQMQEIGEGNIETDNGSKGDNDGWIEPTEDNDDFCPYRNAFGKCKKYTTRCDKGEAVSHVKLRSLLVQEGCEDYEVGEVFFGLLQCLPPNSSARMAGCIPTEVFAENFASVAEKRTNIDPARCRAIAAGDLGRLQLCRRASLSFGSMFTKLQSTREGLSMVNDLEVGTNLSLSSGDDV